MRSQSPVDTMNNIVKNKSEKVSTTIIPFKGVSVSEITSHDKEDDFKKTTITKAFAKPDHPKTHPLIISECDTQEPVPSLNDKKHDLSEAKVSVTGFSVADTTSINVQQKESHLDVKQELPITINPIMNDVLSPLITSEVYPKSSTDKLTMGLNPKLEIATLALVDQKVPVIKENVANEKEGVFSNVDIAKSVAKSLISETMPSAITMEINTSDMTQDIYQKIEPKLEAAPAILADQKTAVIQENICIEKEAIIQSNKLSEDNAKTCFEGEMTSAITSEVQTSSVTKDISTKNNFNKEKASPSYINQKAPLVEENLIAESEGLLKIIEMVKHKAGKRIEETKPSPLTIEVLLSAITKDLPEEERPKTTAAALTFIEQFVPLIELNISNEKEIPLSELERNLINAKKNIENGMPSPLISEILLSYSTKNLDKQKIPRSDNAVVDICPQTVPLTEEYLIREKEGSLTQEERQRKTAKTKLEETMPTSIVSEVNLVSSTKQFEAMTKPSADTASIGLIGQKVPVVEENYINEKEGIVVLKENVGKNAKPNLEETLPITITSEVQLISSTENFSASRQPKTNTASVSFTGQTAALTSEKYTNEKEGLFKPAETVEANAKINLGETMTTSITTEIIASNHVKNLSKEQVPMTDEACVTFIDQRVPQVEENVFNEKEGILIRNKENEVAAKPNIETALTSSITTEVELASRAEKLNESPNPQTDVASIEFSKHNVPLVLESITNEMEGVLMDYKIQEANAKSNITETMTVPITAEIFSSETSKRYSGVPEVKFNNASMVMMDQKVPIIEESFTIDREGVLSTDLSHPTSAKLLFEDTKPTSLISEICLASTADYIKTEKIPKSDVAFCSYIDNKAPIVEERPIAEKEGIFKEKVLSCVTANLKYEEPEQSLITSETQASSSAVILDQMQLPSGKNASLSIISSKAPIVSKSLCNEKEGNFSPVSTSEVSAGISFEDTMQTSITAEVQTSSTAKNLQEFKLPTEETALAGFVNTNVPVINENICNEKEGDFNKIQDISSSAKSTIEDMHASPITLEVVLSSSTKKIDQTVHPKQEIASASFIDQKVPITEERFCEERESLLDKSIAEMTKAKLTLTDTMSSSLTSEVLVSTSTEKMKEAQAPKSDKAIYSLVSQKAPIIEENICPEKENFFHDNQVIVSNAKQTNSTYLEPLEITEIKSEESTDNLNMNNLGSHKADASFTTSKTAVVTNVIVNESEGKHKDLKLEFQKASGKIDTCDAAVHEDIKSQSPINELKEFMQPIQQHGKSSIVSSNTAVVSETVSHDKEDEHLSLKTQSFNLRGEIISPQITPLTINETIPNAETSDLKQTPLVHNQAVPILVPHNSFITSTIDVSEKEKDYSIDQVKTDKASVCLEIANNSMETTEISPEFPVEKLSKFKADQISAKAAILPMNAIEIIKSEILENEKVLTDELEQRIEIMPKIENLHNSIEVSEMDIKCNIGMLKPDLDISSNARIGYIPLQSAQVLSANIHEKEQTADHSLNLKSASTKPIFIPLSSVEISEAGVHESESNLISQQPNIEIGKAQFSETHTVALSTKVEPSESTEGIKTHQKQNETQAKIIVDAHKVAEVSQPIIEEKEDTVGQKAKVPQAIAKLSVDSFFVPEVGLTVISEAENEIKNKEFENRKEIVKVSYEGEDELETNKVKKMHTAEVKPVIIPLNLADVCLSQSEKTEEGIALHRNKNKGNIATVDVVPHHHTIITQPQIDVFPESLKVRSAPATGKVLIEEASHITQTQEIVSDSVIESDIKTIPKLQRANASLDTYQSAEVTQISAYNETEAMKDLTRPTEAVARAAQASQQGIYIEQPNVIETSVEFDKKMILKGQTAHPSIDHSDHITVSEMRSDEKVESFENLIKTEKARSTVKPQESISITSVTVNEGYEETLQPKFKTEKAHYADKPQEHLLIQEVKSEEVTGDIAIHKPNVDQAHPVWGSKEAVSISEITSEESPLELQVNKPLKQTAQPGIKSQNTVTISDVTVHDFFEYTDHPKTKTEKAQQSALTQEHVSIAEITTHEHPVEIQGKNLNGEHAKSTINPIESIIISETSVEEHPDILKQKKRVEEHAVSTIKPRESVAITDVTIHESYEEVQKPKTKTDKANIITTPQQHFSVQETEVHETTQKVLPSGLQKEKAKSVLPKNESVEITEISIEEMPESISIGKPITEKAKTLIKPNEGITVSSTIIQESYEDTEKPKTKTEKAVSSTTQQQHFTVHEPNIQESICDIEAAKKAKQEKAHSILSSSESVIISQVSTEETPVKFKGSSLPGEHAKPVISSQEHVLITETPSNEMPGNVTKIMPIEEKAKQVFAERHSVVVSEVKTEETPTKTTLQKQQQQIAKTLLPQQQQSILIKEVDIHEHPESFDGSTPKGQQATKKFTQYDSVTIEQPNVQSTTGEYEYNKPHESTATPMFDKLSSVSISEVKAQETTIDHENIVHANLQKAKPKLDEMKVVSIKEVNVQEVPSNIETLIVSQKASKILPDLQQTIQISEVRSEESAVDVRLPHNKEEKANITIKPIQSFTVTEVDTQESTGHIVEEDQQKQKAKTNFVPRETITIEEISSTIAPDDLSQEKFIEQRAQSSILPQQSVSITEVNVEEFSQKTKYVKPEMNKANIGLTAADSITIEEIDVKELPKDFKESKPSSSKAKHSVTPQESITIEEVSVTEEPEKFYDALPKLEQAIPSVRANQPVSITETQIESSTEDIIHKKQKPEKATVNISKKDYVEVLEVAAEVAPHELESKNEMQNQAKLVVTETGLQKADQEDVLVLRAPNREKKVIEVLDESEIPIKQPKHKKKKSVNEDKKVLEIYDQEFLDEDEEVFFDANEINIEEKADIKEEPESLVTAEESKIVIKSKSKPVKPDESEVIFEKPTEDIVKEEINEEVTIKKKPKVKPKTENKNESVSIHEETIVSEEPETQNVQIKRKKKPTKKDSVEETEVTIMKPNEKPNEDLYEDVEIKPKETPEREVTVQAEVENFEVIQKVEDINEDVKVKIKPKKKPSKEEKVEELPVQDVTLKKKPKKKLSKEDITEEFNIKQEPENENAEFTKEDVTEDVKLKIKPKKKTVKPVETIEESVNITQEQPVQPETTEVTIKKKPKKTQPKDIEDEVVLKLNEEETVIEQTTEEVDIKLKPKKKKKQVIEENVEVTLENIQKDVPTEFVTEDVTLKKKPKKKPKDTSVSQEIDVEKESESVKEEITEEVNIKMKPKKKPIKKEPDEEISMDLKTEEITEEFQVKRKPKTKKIVINEDYEESVTLKKRNDSPIESEVTMIEPEEPEEFSVAGDITLEKEPISSSKEEVTEEVSIKRKTKRKPKVKEDISQDEVTSSTIAVEDSKEETDDDATLKELSPDFEFEEEVPQEFNIKRKPKAKPKKYSITEEEESFTIKKPKEKTKEASPVEESFSITKEVPKEHQEIEENIDIRMHKPTDFTTEETTEDVQIRMKKPKKKKKKYSIQEESADSSLILPAEEEEEQIEIHEENVIIRKKKIIKTDDTDESLCTEDLEESVSLSLPRKKKYKVENEEVEVGIKMRRPKPQNYDDEDISQTASIQMRESDEDWSTDIDEDLDRDTEGSFTFMSKRRQQQIKKQLQEIDSAHTMKIPIPPLQPPEMPQG